MKKSTFIAVIALLVALCGIVIALVAYLSRKKCVVCDDLEDELFYDDDNDDIEYYATQIQQEDEACACEHCGEEANPVQETENDGQEPQE